MTTRWKHRAAICSFSALCSLAGAVGADSYVFIINGRIASEADCATSAEDLKSTTATKQWTCGLYWGQIAQSEATLTTARTTPQGRFKLIPDGVSNTLQQRELQIACKPQNDVPCFPHPLAPADYSLQRGSLTIADVEISCTASIAGSSPTKTGEALIALAETHQVFAWAGVETLEEANAAVMDAVARADEAFSPDQRELLKTAIASAAAPFRSRSKTTVPLLPSLKDRDFAEELVASAPGWRWLRRPETNRQGSTPYGEREGRFEGDVIHRVGATLDNALVSLSEGPLTIAPETQLSQELSWPASAAPRVCLESSPMVPRVAWKMRASAGTHDTSFTWNLSTARAAGIKNNILGVVARSCDDAASGQRRYIPVRSARTGPTAGTYRFVFLFSRQLTAIDLKFSQGDAANPRVIDLPPGAIKFDRDAQTPTITVDLPTSTLSAGAVNLDMSGKGPGRFGPERLSFIHSQQ